MLKKQSGAVLVISLIILFILTALVLSGTQSTLMQGKMTSAIRDAHISLEIAESGLKDAEEMIEGLSAVTGFNATGTGGLYSENMGPTDIFADANWVDNLTLAGTTSTVSSGQVSRYFVEYVGQLTLDDDLSGLNITGYGETKTGGDIHGFKAVSRSVGRDGNTERIIVGYYGKRF
jgi:type IV pilus assembly protein PilX